LKLIMIKFQWKYFGLAILLFVVEVLIALYINDSFIRPYFGDFLVVILIYCFLKSFWNARVKTVAISVLLFSYFVEISQYFKIVKLLGLQNSKLANISIGNSFAWVDMLAYTLGILFVLFVEKIMAPKSKKG
jgi:DNA integrity scanning protein DisA with diadenylate cyclase activity